MIRAEYGAVMAVIVLPILIICMLTDLTKKGVISLLFASAIAATVYMVHLTWIGRLIEQYFSVNERVYVLLSLAALGLIVYAAVFSHKRSRAYASLNWPKSITQRNMEQHGISILKADGWSSKEGLSFSGRRGFWCSKEKQSIYVVFVKEQHFDYASFLNGMRNQRINLAMLTVFFYENPPETLVNAAQHLKILMLQYKSIQYISEIVASKKEADRKAQATRRHVEAVTRPLAQ